MSHGPARAHRNPRTKRPSRRVAFLSLAISVLVLFLSSSGSTFAHSTEPPALLSTWGGCGNQRGFQDLCWGAGEPWNFRFPTDVTVDDEGFVYVAEKWRTSIQKLSPEGVPLLRWGRSGGDPGEFRNGPACVAWGPDHALYVADGGNHRVQKFDRDGNHVDTWDGPSLFRRPVAIDFDSNGHVFVLDYDAVLRFDTDGTLLERWVVEFRTPRTPYALAILNDDTVLISDDGYGVRHFTADGTGLGRWGDFEQDGGQVEEASDITVADDGRVFIVDRQNHRVQVLSPTGDRLQWFGVKGFDPGEFYLPQAIALRGDFLYVADFGNSNVHALTWRSVVDTDPPGLRVLIDGKEYTAPATFVPSGGPHLIEVISQEDDGTRWEFDHWSDDGGAAHFVQPQGPTRYVATFDTLHRLDVTADAGVNTFPASQWVLAGDSVTLDAAPANGTSRVRWIGTGPGSYTGELLEVTITPEGPVTQHATLAPLFPPYDLAISASSTDPLVQSSPSTGAIRNLYLWMTCAPDGWSALEAQVEGSLDVLAFVPANGVLNAGGPAHLLLATGDCPAGESVNRLLGHWIVNDIGGTLCLGEPESGVFGVVDCATPTPSLTPNPGLLGFSSSGSPPCDTGANGCGSSITTALTGAAGLRNDSVAPLPFAARPNPFHQNTTLRYSVPAASSVSVSVFDVAGRLVRRLHEGLHPPGRHELTWDGRTREGRVVPTGVYFVRLDLGGTGRTEKVVKIAR